MTYIRRLIILLIATLCCAAAGLAMAAELPKQIDVRIITGGIGDIRCDAQYQLTFRANRIFMSLAALNCGGSNISSPAQGVVFPVNGKEKQNFQCEQKEGSTTRKCSNGESYKFDALSGSGSYLEETTRTVESKFNGGTLTLTTQSRVEGLVKVVFDSQVTQKVVLKLSGNGCSISAFDTAITTKGMPGSKTKMLKQVSCTVQ